jgi:hypothetical protein
MHDYERFRIRPWQGFEQHRVDDREDGRRGRDAEAERQACGDRKAGTMTPAAERVLDVARQGQTKDAPAVPHRAQEGVEDFGGVPKEVAGCTVAAREPSAVFLLEIAQEREAVRVRSADAQKKVERMLHSADLYTAHCATNQPVRLGACVLAQCFARCPCEVVDDLLRRARR